MNSWSPDGTTLACAAVPKAGGNSNIYLVSPSEAVISQVTPNSFNDRFPTYSPDGSELAFYRNGNGATPGVYVSDALGTNPQLLLTDPSSTGANGGLASLYWSPFQASETFVGSHGTITASPVAGFLVSQNASQFASVLTFTATTPSTATLTESAVNASGAPMVFTLGADSITNISYTNVYSGAHSTIPLTSTPTALVTVDATTGFVDYVVPAIAMKGKSMAVQRSGAGLSYTGQFAAIYDKTGKNLAPNGATVVQFDKSTGKLISFR